MLPWYHPIFISAQTMVTARAGVHYNLNTAPRRVPEVPYNGLHLTPPLLSQGSLVLLPIIAFTFTFILYEYIIRG